MDEKMTLWTLFGTDTEVGRHLRTLFGPPVQKTAVLYPKIRLASTSTVPTSSALTNKPKIKYPKYGKESSPKKSLESQLHRRKPLTEIRKDIEAIRQSLPQIPQVQIKDRDLMKSQLQERFQFGSISEERVEDPAKTVPPQLECTENAIQDLVQDIRRYQDELEKLETKSQKNSHALEYDRTVLKNKIRSHIQSLHALSRD